LFFPPPWPECPFFLLFPPFTAPCQVPQISTVMLFEPSYPRPLGSSEAEAYDDLAVIRPGVLAPVCGSTSLFFCSFAPSWSRAFVSLFRVLVSWVLSWRRRLVRPVKVEVFLSAFLEGCTLPLCGVAFRFFQNPFSRIGYGRSTTFNTALSARLAV